MRSQWYSKQCFLYTKYVLLLLVCFFFLLIAFNIFYAIFMCWLFSYDVFGTILFLSSKCLFSRICSVSLLYCFYDLFFGNFSRVYKYCIIYRLVSLVGAFRILSEVDCKQFYFTSIFILCSWLLLHMRSQIWYNLSCLCSPPILCAHKF